MKKIIQRLIEIREAINNPQSVSAEKYKYIRDLNQLELTLNALSSHIGNDIVKDDVSEKIYSIIRDIYNEREHGVKYDRSKNNICIYGIPGTGKTTIAKLIGEIMISVGALDKISTYEACTEKFTKMGDQMDEGLILPFLLLLFYASSSMSLGLNKKTAGIVAFIIIILVIGIFIYWYYSGSESENESETKKKKPKPYENKYSYKTQSVVMASPSDFVASYLGQTVPKSEAFISSNKGNVIIIDETYEFASSDRDMFGKKALTVINASISENPGDIIYIFIGYKDKMIETVFKLQPGLERRFNWHFDCLSYSNEELFSIFEIKLKEKRLNYNQSDRRQIIELFSTCEFKDQGGDIEKLTNRVNDIYVNGIDWICCKT